MAGQKARSAFFVPDFPAIHVLILDPRIALGFASLVRGWN